MKNKNLSQSVSILNGIEASAFENIILLDGDLQNDPKDFIPMINKYTANENSVVHGNRKFRKDPYWSKILPSKFANFIVRKLTNSKISNFLLKNEKVAEGIAKMHPLKRIGKGEDSASVAKFLLTDESAWITGQILGVDGGRSSVA